MDKTIPVLVDVFDGVVVFRNDVPDVKRQRHQPNTQQLLWQRLADVAEIPSREIFVGNPKAEITITEFGEYNENDDCSQSK